MVRGWPSILQVMMVAKKSWAARQQVLWTDYASGPQCILRCEIVCSCFAWVECLCDFQKVFHCLLVGLGFVVTVCGDSLARIVGFKQPVMPQHALLGAGSNFEA